MKPTIEHAKKIISLLDHGLVKGLGKPEPGKMCVEAAVCFAMGLPHDDNPPCVGKSVRKYKISLNDLDIWPSDKIRGEWMKPLAIAQLGSDEINQDEFNKEIFNLTQERIIPISFDYIKEKYRIKEHDDLKQFCLENKDLEVLKEKFKNYNNKYYNNYNKYYNYYYNYNNYYFYNYFYNYYYKPEFKEVLLKLSIEVGVQALKNLKSPGCEWLYLLDKKPE